MATTLQGYRFEWIDVLKGWAIAGILLNHFVEEFFPGFGIGFPFRKLIYNAEDGWVMFHSLSDAGSAVGLFLAWLGDQGPGVFILLSGLALTYSVYSKNNGKIRADSFFNKRIGRIYPLYFTIHFGTLAALILLPKLGIDWDPARIFLSTLGIRPTDALFFFINPSWWFIWLILQLYILFPWLFNLMKKAGVGPFLVLTLLFTILSRLAGLLDLTYSGSQYYWMTGSFFGTRLAEFTMGMSFGAYLWKRGEMPVSIPIFKTIPRSSLFFLAVGIAASSFRGTQLFSSLFLTLGLSGVFYGFYRIVHKFKQVLIEKALIWIGTYAYGIYLLHQAPLQWTSAYFKGSEHVLAAALMLILSIPLAWFTERGLQRLLKRPGIALKPAGQVVLLLFLDAAIVGICVLLNGFILNPEGRKLLYLMLISGFFILSFVFFRVRNSIHNSLLHVLQYVVLLAVVLILLVVPYNYPMLALVFATLVFLIAVPICQKAGRAFRSFLIGLAGTIVLFLVVELVLWQWVPMETNRWGEFRALQKHPTRTYGLKPNKQTHLRYNNYDYTLNTNEYGLNSPPVDTSIHSSNQFRIFVVGDAFTMPEGLNYTSSYTFLLDSMLAYNSQDVEFEVINGGITGYGPVEQLVQMQELLPLFKPDLVVYQYFINEILQVSMKDKRWRLNNIGFLEVFPGFRDWIAGYTQIGVRAARFTDCLRSYIRHRPPDWKMQKSLLMYYEKDNSLIYNEENISDLGATLDSMSDLCSRYNSDFFIVFVPGQVAVSKPADIAYLPYGIEVSDTSIYSFDHPIRVLTRIVKPLGIEVFDLTAPLKEHPFQPVYYEKSWHWNEEGHLVASDFLFKLLTDRYITNQIQD